MRLSNYTDLCQIAYRDPVIGGDYSYLTGLSLSEIEYKDGFSISSGFLPNSEPATFSFSIKKHAGIDNAEFTDFMAVADLGYEIRFQTIYYDGFDDDMVPTAQHWENKGPRFLIKTMDVIPDYLGNLECRITCEDLMSRAMNVPITMSGYPISVTQSAWERFQAIMNHIDAYYDGIFPEFTNGYYNGGFGVDYYNSGYSIWVPPVTGGAYNAEPAGGILNDILNTDLAWFNFGNGGYEYRAIPFWSPLNPEIWPLPNDPFIGSVPLNAPLDLEPPGAMRNRVTEITIVNDSDEVIPCLRVELASTPATHYSWQDNAAILKYGAKYVKQSINAYATISTDSGTYNSVEVYGKSLQSPNNTERVTNMRFSAIDRRTDLLQYTTVLNGYSPGQICPIWYLTDDYEHAENYIVLSETHTINQNSWDISVDVWKPTLTNGFAA